MTLLLLALGCARSFHDARSYPCPEDGGATFAASGPLTFRDAGPGKNCAIHAASATFPNRDEATYTRITAVELFGLPSYDLSWESQPDVADATLTSIDWAPSAEAEADLREVVRVTAPREGSGTLDWDAAPELDAALPELLACAANPPEEVFAEARAHGEIAHQQKHRDHAEMK